MAKREHVGPIFNLIKKKITKPKVLKSFHGQQKVRFFLKKILLNLLSSILEFLTVRIRRVKHGKCSTRQGLRVSTKNTRFHREFR